MDMGSVSQARPNPASKQPPPAIRKLRGYAFDPSYSGQTDTAIINEMTYDVVWERELQAGPVGEYIEVIDYDPASGCFYEPVDLNDTSILAQDGLAPSDGSPHFHQQFVYAVAMTTIRNFEVALGRSVLWRARRPERITRETEARENVVEEKSLDRKKRFRDQFVRQLRIYPHATRDANAYYSHKKIAVLFGYFPAFKESIGRGFPGGMVFTCLSHDIVTHEVTHAILDGMHTRFLEPTNVDVLSFHEAFADLVALLQHFTYRAGLRQQIARTRGDIKKESLLGQLAGEFGVATGKYGALRSAIGEYDKESGQWSVHEGKPEALSSTKQPHARGAILVGAVFDAMITIYNSRTADLLRIATNGTGVLPAGDLHPDLVVRLADEAARVARQVLNMCIRALDYCPPVDITFGEFLRALITGDVDLVPYDDRHYRVAFLEAFRRRAIYPQGVRTLSLDSLRWPQVPEDTRDLFLDFRPWYLESEKEPISPTSADRSDTFTTAQNLAYKLHLYIKRQIIISLQRDRGLPYDPIILDPDTVPKTQWSTEQFQELTKLCILGNFDAIGLARDKRVSDVQMRQGEYMYLFEVSSVRYAQRQGPDGDRVNQLVFTITQQRVDDDPATEDDDELVTPFRGGCTMVLDLATFELKYCIVKDIRENARLAAQRQYQEETFGSELSAIYFDSPFSGGEPMAALHSDRGDL